MRNSPISAARNALLGSPGGSPQSLLKDLDMDSAQGSPKGGRKFDSVLHGIDEAGYESPRGARVASNSDSRLDIAAPGSPRGVRDGGMLGSPRGGRDNGSLGSPRGGLLGSPRGERSVVDEVSLFPRERMWVLARQFVRPVELFSR